MTHDIDRLLDGLAAALQPTEAERARIWARVEPEILNDPQPDPRLMIEAIFRQAFPPTGSLTYPMHPDTSGAA